MSKWIWESVFLENGKCPICNRALFFTRKHLCKTCMERLETAKVGVCLRCGRGKGQDRLEICLDCLNNPPVFRKGYCGFVYQSDVKGLVYAMKFKNRPGLCRFSGEWVAGILEKRHGVYSFDTVQGIIPVALHSETRATRGYNQSEELAIGFMNGWNWKDGQKPEILTDVLEKHGDGTHQRELGRRERQLHAEKIFRVKSPEKIQGLHVLLVDDVLTTGATVNACAKTLLEAGAKTVDVLVFASVEA